MDRKKIAYTGQAAAHVIDCYDRPGKAFAKRTYANAGKYAYAFTNKPGQRMPKAGVVAEAGVGRARAEWSVFEAEAKGPNASASAQASILEAGAMARAEVGSASASAGPVGVKVALGVDTGVTIGLAKAEIKILGCGLSIGSTMSASLFGSEVSFRFW